MTYVTFEAEIENGRIVPKEGAKLPEHGHALVTILPESPRRPDWEKVESMLGILHRPDLDSSVWQRQVRSEWEQD